MGVGDTIIPSDTSSPLLIADKPTYLPTSAFDTGLGESPGLWVAGRWYGKGNVPSVLEEGGGPVSLDAWTEGTRRGGCRDGELGMVVWAG